jgi:hypothetical protein
MLLLLSHCYIAVPGFQDAIRGYVLHSISITFQRVSARVLGDWLKLDGSALQQLLADKVCYLLLLAAQADCFMYLSDSLLWVWQVQVIIS